MVKFSELTKLIPELQKGDFGEWAVDTTNEGTPEHPVQLPFVIYSDSVNALRMHLFSFCSEHPELEYTSYGDTLDRNGIDLLTASMEGADLSGLDGKAVIALLVAAFRAERFCDGAILGFCESGAIIRWLQRLEELDKIAKK